MSEEKHRRSIVGESVEQTLSGLGFDLTQRQQLQADLLFLRRLRLNKEDWARRFRQAVMAWLIPMLGYLIVYIIFKWM